MKIELEVKPGNWEEQSCWRAYKKAVQS